MTNEMESLFNPQSLAVAGVTEDRFNLGFLYLNENEKMGFKGILYAISRRGKIAHYPTYQRVIGIPGPVDVVIILVPINSVLQVLQDCVAKGVKWAVLDTSGFSETGKPEGEELEKKVLEIITGSRTRVIGPNCMGPYSPISGIAFERSLSEKKDDIAFISQSGALSILLARVAKEKGFGFSKVISYGNECDVTGVDFFEYIAGDQQTKIVAAYIETAKDEQRFLRALENITKSKPVIILKGGTTNSGIRAALYHTASDAGFPDHWEEILRKAGAVQVESFEELVDAIITFKFARPPKGRRTVTISPSGGMSVLFTDLAEKKGFTVPELSQQTQKRLEEIFAAGTSARNPLDLAGYSFFNLKTIRETIAILDADEEVDSIIFHLPMDFLMPIIEDRPWYEEKFLSTLVNSKPANKPLIIVMPHTIGNAKRTEVEKILLEQNLPVYPTIERAINALTHLINYRAKQVKY